MPCAGVYRGPARRRPPGELVHFDQNVAPASYRMQISLKTSWALLLMTCASFRAPGQTVIEAAPGDGTISRAAAQAKPGDTIQLQAGEYVDAVSLPKEVHLRGAGVTETVLTVRDKEVAAVRAAGQGSRLSRVTLGGTSHQFGVLSASGITIERCVFKQLGVGVSLIGAPLTDVVQCDFLECSQGIRLAGASPSIAGCYFRGGVNAVSAGLATPYFSDNLCEGQSTAVFLSVGEEPPTLTNNLFLGCKDGVSVVLLATATDRQCVRDNVFQKCGASFRGNAKDLRVSSGSILVRTPMPAGAPPGEARFRSVGAELAMAGPIVEGRPAGPGDADLDAVRLDAFGTRVAGPLLPPRISGEVVLVNSVSEIHAVLGEPRMRVIEQSIDGAGRLVVRWETPAAEGRYIFDCSRFTERASPLSIKSAD
jgi:hypothetical protein